MKTKKFLKQMDMEHVALTCIRYSRIFFSEFLRLIDSPTHRTMNQ